MVARTESAGEEDKAGPWPDPRPRTNRWEEAVSAVPDLGAVFDAHVAAEFATRLVDDASRR